MLRQPKSGTLAVLLIATIVALSAIAFAAPGQSKKAKRSKKPAAVAQVTPPPIPRPEPPKTPFQMPPVAPTVTYSNGLLSIDAPNSSLSDVLGAVRRATGANIEGGGSERIVVHIGPGRPRDVLSSLLQGSRYDFIILGPKGDPSGVQRVVLMARGGGAGPMQNAGGQPQAPVQSQMQPMPQAANTNPNEDEEAPEQEEEISPKGLMTPEPDGPPSQPMPEPEGAQPQPNAAPQQGGEQQQQQEQQQGPQVKTPEQLFKELQQLQQQQQQQQQNQR